jgi:hypothetical protein
MPPRPPRGPELMFTSAKNWCGRGGRVWLRARRVVMRWEWEEAHMRAPNLVREWQRCAP